MKNPKQNAVALASVLMISALTLLQSCTDGKSAAKIIPTGSEPIPVKIVALEKSGTTSLITASGQLITEDETVLAFKTAGVVNTVLVREGDQVKKGQLLATLDLTEINAHVAQARFGFEKAERDFQRLTNLYRDSVATLEQLQNGQTALNVARQQLEAATFNRSFSAIHAPANGFVLRKFVNSGQVVSIGDPILLTNAAVQNKWILKIGVSDKQWASIRIKDKASIKLDAFPEKIFEGTVTRKAETSDPQTGTFTVELILKNEGEKLATGMFGSASLQSGVAVTSWSVPYEAVLDANDNEGFVFVTSDEKIAHRAAVTIESFDGKTMRISKGLEGAGSLIVSGSAYLTDLSPIRIIK